MSLFTCQAEGKIPFDFVKHVVREYKKDGNTQIQVLREILPGFVELPYKGQTIIFLSGDYHFWDLQTIFLKSNTFQTISFITFCNENNFFTTIFKNITGIFIDLI